MTNHLYQCSVQNYPNLDCQIIQNKDSYKNQNQMTPLFQQNKFDSTSTIKKKKQLTSLQLSQKKQSNQHQIYQNLEIKRSRLNDSKHLFNLIEQPNYQHEKYQNLFTFNKLLQQEQLYQCYSHQNIGQINQKICQINKKFLNSSIFYESISSNFYLYFENFSFLIHQSKFINELNSNLVNFIQDQSKYQKQGKQVIILLYEYWIKLFSQLIKEITNYNQKFTLDYIKQQNANLSFPIKRIIHNTNDINSIQGQKDKRKQWSNKQIQILSFMIQEGNVFNISKLKDLSHHFNRSINSISSKIQKIIREKKNQDGYNRLNEYSLLKKIIETLKVYPQGLNKDQVIIKLQEEHQMGTNQKWKKSATQLLSSSRQILRKKGIYKLKEPYQNNLDKAGVTLKSKVIQCLLKFDNLQGDLKQIAQKYIDLYGVVENITISDQQKIKQLEAAISKTLCRYDIFDKSRSRTLYFSIFQRSQMSIQKFIT